MTNSDKPMIAIVLTTFLRDELLAKSVASIKANWHSEFYLIIVDQNPTEEKAELYKEFRYIGIQYDSGLSVARNIGCDIAREEDIPYCLITADSIEFNESIKNLTFILSALEQKTFDLIGLNLLNRRFGWEASINLVEGKYFELDFIDKTLHKNDLENGQFVIHKCEIVRNFFIASTSSLREVEWDDNLKMAEHEDFFYRYKLAGKKVGWTNICVGNYIGVRNEEYGKIRNANWNKYTKVLKEKYKITGWVNYVNLERAKE